MRQILISLLLYFYKLAYIALINYGLVPFSVNSYAETLTYALYQS